MVGVPSEAPPLSAAVRDLGPTLGIVAVGLLVAGTSIAALLIFRPTRRRLRVAAGRGAGASAPAKAARAPPNPAATKSRCWRTRSTKWPAASRSARRRWSRPNESRRQLLADVSHELMTPLAAIRGYVETMTMADVKLDEPTRQRYLGIVADETERLEHIIGDLLDLARLEGGGGAWKREPVSVAGAVRARAAPARSACCRARASRSTRRSRRTSTDVIGRSESARAGAAESGGERGAPHARRRARHARSPSASTTACGWRSRTAGPGIPAGASAARLRSFLQGGRVAHRHAACRRAAASDCRSCRRSCAGTAARSRPATPRTAARDSRSCCRRFKTAGVDFFWHGPHCARPFRAPKNRLPLS